MVYIIGQQKSAARKAALLYHHPKDEGRDKDVGSGLRSQTVARPVPSTLMRLTAGFGMEPGVPARLKPPTTPSLPASTPVSQPSTNVFRNPASSCFHARTVCSPHNPQSPRPLVRVRSTHCCASTSRLSSWSSSSGLTPFQDKGSHLEVGFPLRCFQRFSAPELATRPCRWHDNRRTSAPSIPVLSY
jgi:hypothetical protein